MATRDTGMTFNSVLADAWNTALGTFERWIDHQLPEAEVQIARENSAAAAQLQQSQAPQAIAPAGLPGGDTTILVGGAVVALVVLLALRR